MDGGSRGNQCSACAGFGSNMSPKETLSASQVTKATAVQVSAVHLDKAQAYSRFRGTEAHAATTGSTPKSRFQMCFFTTYSTEQSDTISISELGSDLSAPPLRKRMSTINKYYLGLLVVWTRWRPAVRCESPLAALQAPRPTCHAGRHTADVSVMAAIAGVSRR